jgi:hypothetical protein
VTETFVPSDFVVPTMLSGDGFRLEPLGPKHNVRDHSAWMSSIDHIKAIPAFTNAEWPFAMSLERNLSDLDAHARDFEDRTGFTYSILDGEEVIGCTYLYPSAESDHDANMKWWLTKSRSKMAPAVGEALSVWLEDEWPFESPSR